MLGVQILFLVPLGLAVVLLVQIIFRKWWALSCWAAFLMLFPGFISFASGGVHLSLGLVMADLCFDMDNHIHYYVYSNATNNLPENVNFLPANTSASDLCGPDGELAFLEGEINNGLDTAVSGFCGVLETMCESTGPDHYFMDCDSITLGGAWSGTYASGYTTSCDRFTPISTIPSTLQLRNIAADPRGQDITTMSPAMKTCLAIQSSSTAGQPYHGDYDGLPAPVTPAWAWDPNAPTVNETTATTLMANTAPTEADVLQCLAETSPLVSVADCATQCTAGLPEDISMRSVAQQLDSNITSTAATLTTINTLMADDVSPILQCKFIGDIYEGLYYPLCVEAMPGISFICASNLISGITLIFGFPLAIMNSKRVRQDHRKGCCKIPDADFDNDVSLAYA